jgi:hypothetical protein
MTTPAKNSGKSQLTEIATIFTSQIAPASTNKITASVNKPLDRLLRDISEYSIQFGRSSEATGRIERVVRLFGHRSTRHTIRRTNSKVQRSHAVSCLAPDESTQCPSTRSFV